MVFEGCAAELSPCSTAYEELSGLNAFRHEDFDSDDEDDDQVFDSGDVLEDGKFIEKVSTCCLNCNKTFTSHLTWENACKCISTTCKARGVCSTCVSVVHAGTSTSAAVAAATGVSATVITVAGTGVAVAGATYAVCAIKYGTNEDGERTWWSKPALAVKDMHDNYVQISNRVYEQGCDAIAPGLFDGIDSSHANSIRSGVVPTVIGGIIKSGLVATGVIDLGISEIVGFQTPEQAIEGTDRDLENGGIDIESAWNKTVDFTKWVWNSIN